MTELRLKMADVGQVWHWGAGPVKDVSWYWLAHVSGVAGARPRRSAPGGGSAGAVA